MTDTIEIYIDHAGKTQRVGQFRYVAKRRGQSSLGHCEILRLIVGDSN